MVELELGSVKLRLDFSFFAAVGIFLAFDGTGYGMCCLAACFCHEAGHLVVMLLQKKPPREIIFSGGGICIRQREDSSSAVLAAGCAVNFILFFIYCLILPKDNIFRLLFGGANLAIGLFNMLPAGELDGKMLLERACCRLLSFEGAERMLRTAEILGYSALAGAIVFLGAMGLVNLSAATVMVYVFLMDILVGQIFY